MFLRAVITLQTVALFAAPITAGLMLSSPGNQPLHSAAAYSVFAVAVVHLIAAIWVWRRGSGSSRPVAHAAVFLGLTLAQVALGIAQVTTLHVPLGVLMFGLSVLQLSRAWSDRRAHVAVAAPGH